MRLITCMHVQAASSWAALVCEISTRGNVGVMRKRHLSDTNTKLSLCAGHELFVSWSTDYLTKGSLSPGHGAIQLVETIGRRGQQDILGPYRARWTPGSWEPHTRSEPEGLSAETELPAVSGLPVQGRCTGPAWGEATALAWTGGVREGGPHA